MQFYTTAKTRFKFRKVTRPSLQHLPRNFNISEFSGETKKKIMNLIPGNNHYYVVKCCFQNNGKGALCVSTIII